MIKGFRDRTTEAVFPGENPKGFPSDLVKVARRKLGYLDAAHDFATAGAAGQPPALSRLGTHSIRRSISICRWRRRGPADVEITDYH